jgi:hypothetical protein
MKKAILAAVVLFLVVAIFTSCGASRKTGCPMAERVIH